MTKDLYNQTYYESNKERIKAKRRERYLENRGEVLSISPESKEENGSSSKTQPKKEVANFWRGVQKALRSIDGEKSTKAFPKVLMFLAATFAVFYLFWLQSTELYKSAGFSEPGLIALGGILMISIFAAFHAVSRSNIALALCLYAFGYETYFVVVGTLNDEKVVAEARVGANNELVFLREKIDKVRKEYLRVKARFEDPKSKLFQNAWFKKKFLAPAWEKFESAQREVVVKKAELRAGGNFKQLNILKILYRTGMVLLCMVLVHVLLESRKTAIRSSPCLSRGWGM